MKILTADEINQYESLEVRSPKSITVNVKRKGKRIRLAVAGDFSEEHLRKAISTRDRLRKSLQMSIEEEPERNKKGLHDAYQSMFRAARKRDSYSLCGEAEKRLIDRCGGYCELTGIQFDTTKGSWGRRPYSPSLDRINNAQGYTEANCRIVCVAINLAMNEWGEEVYSYVAARYFSRSNPR